MSDHLKRPSLRTSAQDLARRSGEIRRNHIVVVELWGAVAQWLERATDDRVVMGSNLTDAAWKLWQLPLPHFAIVFQKSRWTLLPGVYAKGSKRSHTGGKCVTCRGLQILPGQ